MLDILKSLKTDRMFMNNPDLRSYLSAKQVLLVERYAAMLEAWNNVHNLISKKQNTARVMIEIIDAALGGNYIQINTPIVDAGSGGGNPGVVLAIMYPDNEFILVDSSRKKCSFLRDIKTSLELKNAFIKNTRIEDLSDLKHAVSKAAFSPENIGVLVDVLAPGGKLSLWSTPRSQESFIGKIGEHGAQLLTSFPYKLPNDHERVILVFRKD